VTGQLAWLLDDAGFLQELDRQFLQLIATVVTGAAGIMPLPLPTEHARPCGCVNTETM
jgi:hypothetical protein